MDYLSKLVFVEAGLVAQPPIPGESQSRNAE